MPRAKTKAAKSLDEPESGPVATPGRKEKEKPLTPEEAQIQLSELLETINPQRTIEVRVFNRVMELIRQRQAETVDALTGVTFYVWRMFPSIDTRLTGRKHSNIQTVRCVDEGTLNPLPDDISQFVQTYHGGGKFRVSINDAYATEGSAAQNNPHKQLCQCVVNISEIEYEPILDPAELVASDNATMNWIQRQVSIGRLIKRGDKWIRPDGATGGDSSGGGNDVAVQALARLADKNANGNAEGGAMTSGIFGLLQMTLGKVMEGNKGGGGTDPAIIALLVNLIENQGKLQAEIVRAQTTAPAAPPPTLDQELERFAKLRELMGGGHRAPAAGTDWAAVIGGLAPLVIPLLTGGRPLPGAPAPAQIAAAAPPPTVRDAGLKLLSHLLPNAARRGQDGTDVGGALEVTLSPEHYDDLRTLGVDGLTAALQASPNVQAIPPELLKELLTQFIAYGDPQQGAAPPPQPEPATTGAAAV